MKLSLYKPIPGWLVSHVDTACRPLEEAQNLTTKMDKRDTSGMRQLHVQRNLELENG